MGQSSEEKKDKAIELELQKIESIKVQYELPIKSIFLGYLIHVVEADEFLHSIKESKDMIARGFVKRPDQAKRFKTENAARKYTRPMKDEIVVALFDVGDQFLITRVN